MLWSVLLFLVEIVRELKQTLITEEIIKIKTFYLHSKQNGENSPGSDQYSGCEGECSRRLKPETQNSNTKTKKDISLDH